jgi:hypothetical protein
MQIFYFRQIFVHFLDKNKALKNKNGQLLIDNNALAATTFVFLFILDSKIRKTKRIVNETMSFLNFCVRQYFFLYSRK